MCAQYDDTPEHSHSYKYTYIQIKQSREIFFLYGDSDYLLPPARDLKRTDDHLTSTDICTDEMREKRRIYQLSSPQLVKRRRSTLTVRARTSRRISRVRDSHYVEDFDSGKTRFVNGYRLGPDDEDWRDWRWKGGARQLCERYGRNRTAVGEIASDQSEIAVALCRSIYDVFIMFAVSFGRAESVGVSFCFSRNRIVEDFTKI